MRLGKAQSKLPTKPYSQYENRQWAASQADLNQLYKDSGYDMDKAYEALRGVVGDTTYTANVTRKHKHTGPYQAEVKYDRLSGLKAKDVFKDAEAAYKKGREADRKLSPVAAQFRLADPYAQTNVAKGGVDVQLAPEGDAEDGGAAAKSTGDFSGTTVDSGGDDPLGQRDPKKKRTSGIKLG